VRGTKTTEGITISGVKLNIDKLVVLAKSGDEQAYARIFKFCIDEVEKALENLWYYIDDYGKIECRCRAKLERALSNYNKDKGSFYKLVKTVVNEVKNEYLKRIDQKVRDRKCSLEYMMELSDQGVNPKAYYDPVDESIAPHHDKIITKEIIAQVALSDKKKFIVCSWLEGITCDTELAELMVAHQYGTNARSQVKFIQRFRTECKSMLATLN
jgi:hypothetical protein